MPPSAEEIEVSIFGPGFGECILVHIGYGEWVIIDSCIDHSSNTAIALKYLSDLRIDASAAVRAVIATHWHDDHVRGLSEVVDICGSARFYCSGALANMEFMKLALAYSSGGMMPSTGVDEIARTIQILAKRRENGFVHAGPHFAQADMTVLKREDTDLAKAEVHALSPSSASIANGRARFSRLLPSESKAKLRLPSLEPNDCSVVIWVRVGDVAVLLGADLEERNDPQTGWQAVISSPNRPTGLASCVKIAHHGSDNGDYVHIWSQLLEQHPHAVVTPFVRGNVTLPSRSNCIRLRQRTNHVYLTARAQSSKTTRRPTQVQKLIKTFVPSLRPIDATQGHVRLRRSLYSAVEQDWRVELFGDSAKIP